MRALKVLVGGALLMAVLALATGCPTTEQRQPPPARPYEHTISTEDEPTPQSTHPTRRSIGGDDW